jgi:hypothetical protein
MGKQLVFHFIGVLLLFCPVYGELSTLENKLEKLNVGMFTNWGETQEKVYVTEEGNLFTNKNN